MLHAHLFGSGQDRFRTAKIENHLVRIDALHEAGDDPALLAGVLGEDRLALRFAQRLQDDLLGGLRLNPAADIFDFMLLAKHRADRDGLVDDAGAVEVDLQVLVGDVFFDLDDLELGPHVHRAVEAVNPHRDGAGQLVAALDRSGHAALNRFEDDVFVERLFGRQLLDRQQKVSLHRVTWPNA